MQAFIGLRPFKAISFDLDDTLYDNLPYITRAEREFLVFMQGSYPATHQWHPEYWLKQEQQQIQKQPELAHDTWQIRAVTIEAILLAQGLSEPLAKQGSAAGMAHFLHHRSDFTVPNSSIELLKNLGKKYPLIGISNGNVDPERIGIEPYFQFILHAGNGLKMKPAADMFQLACQRLSIEPQELLHVGDSFAADVTGARNFGCQSVWLNPSYGRQQAAPLSSPLPQLVIKEIQELKQLI